MNKYEKAHAALWAEMDRRQDGIIAQAREALLIPFCERTGWRFTAGMGSWGFDYVDRYGTRRQVGVWCEEKELHRIPKGLRDFLFTDALGSRNDLGSLMQDYTPITYKPPVIEPKGLTRRKNSI